jgi:acyl carrier protein
MDDTKIYGRLQEIFGDVFDEDDLKISPDMTANDVEEWDSLNHIRMIVAVEEQFGVKFSSAEVGSLNDVAELARLIKSKGHVRG